MARLENLQASFVAGILSPRLLGRFDFARFAAGARDLSNMLTTPQGGILRRPGTRFIAEAKSNDPTVRLVPFQFSTAQTYVLELGPGYMRVCSLSGQVVTQSVGATIDNGNFNDSILTTWIDDSSGGTAAWTPALGGSLSFAGAGGARYQDVAISGGDENTDHTLIFSLYRGTNIRGGGLTVEALDPSTGEVLASAGSEAVPLLVGSHSLVFNPGGLSTVRLRFESLSNNLGNILLDDVQILSDAPFELPSPFETADLPGLKFTQSADILYLAASTQPPYELLRTGPAEFQLQAHDFLDGPYEDTNVTPTTLVADAATTTVNLTASDPIFSNTDVGRLVRILNGSSMWAWLEIVTYSSPTSVVAIHRSTDLAPTVATDVWRLGEWSDTTGWPQVNTLHRGRLVWAANASHPQTLWFSTPDTITSHEPSDPDGTVTDDSGINITILNDQVNAVVWMVGTQEGLLVGTTRTEIIVRRPSLTSGLAPTNIEAVRQSSRGSASSILPALIGRSIVFVQRDSQVIREALFDFDISGFDERDISILAEHLFHPGIVRLVYQQSPISTVWAVLGSGEIATLSFERTQQVFSWGRSELGSTTGGFSDAIDVATITEGDEEQIWLLVYRNIEGEDRQYIEIVDHLRDAEEPIEDSFFVDSGLSGTFDPEVSQVFGLDHLVGETVRILIDGGTHPDVVVAADGSVTLERSGAVIHVGLPQVASFELLPFDLVDRASTSIGLIKNIIEAEIILLGTASLSAGRDFAHLSPVIFRPTEAPMDSPVPLFEGRKRAEVESLEDVLTALVGQSTDPLPLHILGINLTLDVYPIR